MTHSSSTTTNTALIPYPRYAIITIPTPACIAPLEALRYIAACWRVKYARPVDAGIVTASKLFGTPVPGMRGYDFGYQSGDLKAFQSASKSEADVLSLAATEDLEVQDAEEANLIEYPAVEHNAVEEAFAEEIVMENDVEEEEEAILKALSSFFEQHDNTTSISSAFINHVDAVDFEFTAPLIATTGNDETENVGEKAAIQGELESVEEVSPVKSQNIHAEEAPAEDQGIMNEATANSEPVIIHEHTAVETTSPGQHDITHLQATPINMIEECEAAAKESIIVEKEEVIQNEPGSKQIITPAEHNGIQSDATRTTLTATSTFEFNDSKSADFTFRVPPAITTPVVQHGSSNKSEATPTSTTGNLFGTNKLEASAFTFAAPQNTNALPPSNPATTKNADDTATHGTTTDPSSEPMDWKPTPQPSAATEPPHRSAQPTASRLTLITGDPMIPTFPRAAFTFTTPVRTASTRVPTFPPTLFGRGAAAPTPTRFGTAVLRAETSTFSVGEGADAFAAEGAGESAASCVAGEDDAAVIMRLLERVFEAGEKIQVYGEEERVCGKEYGGLKMSGRGGGEGRENGGEKKGAKKGRKKAENKNAGWGRKGGKKGGKGKKN